MKRVPQWAIGLSALTVLLLLLVLFRLVWRLSWDATSGFEFIAAAVLYAVMMLLGRWRQQARLGAEMPAWSLAMGLILLLSSLIPGVGGWPVRIGKVLLGVSATAAGVAGLVYRRRESRAGRLDARPQPPSGGWYPWTAMPGGATTAGRDRGCGYCADERNMACGHVRPIAADSGRGTFLLWCPRCGSLYEGSHMSRVVERLDRESAVRLYPDAHVGS